MRGFAYAITALEIFHNSLHGACLFDHAIGSGQQCERNFEAKHLSKRDCEIVSPSANHWVPGLAIIRLKCHSTFDGLKNTAIQPVKQLG